MPPLTPTDGDMTLHTDTDPASDEVEDIAAACYDADFEPHEGMEFDSEEAARMLYAAYARRAGFRVRISRYTRSRRDNSIISRRIVCSKEGFRHPHPLQATRQRAVTRVGCKAMIMVKRTDHHARWAVTKFVKDHNHGPVSPRKVDYHHLLTNDSTTTTTTTTTISLVPEGHPLQEPFEGMEFDSEEAAKDYYSAYAMQTGFRARISKYCRSRRDNSIISRQIVCSKEGFREMRMKKEMEDDGGRIKRPRVITRIGCKAMMVVKKLTSGKWIISKFEREHNHALIPSKNVPLLQARSSDERSSITKLKEASAGSTTAGCSSGAHGTTSRESLTVMYNQLCYEAIRYAQEGATTLETYNVAIAALREAVEKVAAAKRGVAQPTLLVTGTNQGVALSQGSASFMIPAKTFHELQCPGETRQNIAGQEFMLLQQPVSFVLVPSTPADNSTSSAEPPVIVNVTNGQILHIAPSDAANTTCSSQGMHTSVPVSGAEQSVMPDATSAGGSVGNVSAASDVPAARKRDLPCTDGHAQHNSLQKSQKLESLRLGQASACTNLSAGVPEEQMVTIPALPVTLYMPVMSNLSESRSVAPSGTPGSYALLTSPVETRAVPMHPSGADAQSHTSMQQLVASQSVTQTPTPSDQTKSYTGPNPQVHATALAAGARIIPPKAAASLIKALETRIRSARALVKSPSAGSCKLLDTEACSPQPCDSEEGSQVLGTSSDDPRLCRSEEAMKESDMGTGQSMVMNPG